MILGCDFSHWDGNVDFDRFEASGAQFAFFKAGQGVAVDPVYQRNAGEAARRGIIHGAYWYVDPRVSPKAQAAAVVAVMQQHAGNLPLAMDYEAPDKWGGAYGGWRNLAALMQLVLDSLPGIRLIIYTNYSYWTDHSPSRWWNYASYQWFKQFDLWLAWYIAGDAPPRIPGPWSIWRFWQYSAAGDPNRFGSNKMAVDLDRWNGDYAALQTYAGQIPAPPPPALRQAVTTGNLNVRAGPGTNYPIRGTLLKGTTVSIDAIQTGWAHVVATLGQPLTGWCSELYLRYI